MTACCEDKSCEITGMRERHARVLWVVLLVNAVMFLVESKPRQSIIYLCGE
jgi:hypothetical protein